MERTKEEMMDAVKKYKSGMTLDAVAKRFFVCQATIINWLTKMNVQRRQRGYNIPSNSNCSHWKGGKYGYISRLARKVVVQNGTSLDICSRCGGTDFYPLHVHHKDEDRHNNNIKNLEVLCNSCHMSLHRLKYWRMKKGVQK